MAPEATAERSTLARYLLSLTQGERLAFVVGHMMGSDASDELLERLIDGWPAATPPP